MTFTTKLPQIEKTAVKPMSEASGAFSNHNTQLLETSMID